MEYIGFAFKLIVYVLECEKLGHKPKNISYVELENFLKFLRNFGVKVKENLKLAELEAELTHKDVHGFSSVMILLNLACNCNAAKSIQQINKTLRRNRLLKRITKIVISYSYGKAGAKLLVDKKDIYPKIDLPQNYDQNVGEYSLKMDGQKKMLLLNALKNTKVDNYVYVCCQRTEQNVRGNIYKKILERLLEFARLQSVQEIICNVWRETESEHLAKQSRRSILQFSPSCPEMICYTTTSTVGCYLFSINPAFAIIFNHLTFNQQFAKRESSLRDIEALKQSLALNKIPHIVITNGSVEKVRDLMHTIQSTDLSLLKHLLIFVMSHGSNNGRIYTRTGDYFVQNDILNPLSKNNTLKNVLKLLIVIACRGDLNPILEEPNVIKTDINYLENKTAVIYSAREGCLSLRDPLKGAFFVTKLCKLLNKCWKNYSLRKLHEHIENALLKDWKEATFFESVTEFCSNSKEDQILNMELENYIALVEVYKKIQHYVEQRNNELEKENEEELEQPKQKRLKLQ